MRAISPKPELTTSEPIRLAESDLMRSSLDPIRQATLKPEPLSPEIVTQGQAVEHKIDDAVSNQAAFYLELTEEE